MQYMMPRKGRLPTNWFLISRSDSAYSHITAPRTVMIELRQRKMAVASAAAITLLLGLVAVSYYKHYVFLVGLAGNRIISEYRSPDQQWKAVVFERDAGATTRFSTNVSVLKVSQDLPNAPGSVFGLDAPPQADGRASVEIRWASNLRLVIRYNKSYRVIRQDEMGAKPNVVTFETF